MTCYTFIRNTSIAMFQALIIFGNRGPVLRLHPPSETGASTPPGKAGELARSGGRRSNFSAAGEEIGPLRHFVPFRKKLERGACRPLASRCRPVEVSGQAVQMSDLKFRASTSGLEASGLEGYGNRFIEQRRKIAVVRPIENGSIEANSP
jgi:hypothetical protein